LISRLESSNYRERNENVYMIHVTMIDDYENSKFWLVMSFILSVLYPMHAVARANKPTQISHRTFSSFV